MTVHGCNEIIKSVALASHVLIDLVGFLIDFLIEHKLCTIITRLETKT